MSESYITLIISNAINLAYSLIVFLCYWVKASKNKEILGYFSFVKAVKTSPILDTVAILHLMMLVINGIISMAAFYSDSYYGPVVGYYFVGISAFVTFIFYVFLRTCWKNRRKCVSIFLEKYFALLRITKSSRLSHNAKAELLPAMYVLTDLAVFRAYSDGIDKFQEEIDVRDIKESIILVMCSLDRDFMQSYFDSRFNLYNEACIGRKLRYEWNFGTQPEFTKITSHDDTSEYAASKCAALLGDILYNPACANNYDNAPVLTNDTKKTTAFSKKVVMPLYEGFTKLFNEIYNSELSNSLKKKLLQEQIMADYLEHQRIKDKRSQERQQQKSLEIQKEKEQTIKQSGMFSFIADDPRNVLLAHKTYGNEAVKRDVFTAWKQENSSLQLLDSEDAKEISTLASRHEIDSEKFAAFDSRCYSLYKHFESIWFLKK